MLHTVLLVDDEEFVLKSLARELRKESYNLLCAGSGKEALAILREHAVSVIVSDMQMPEMNGVEFLAEARKLSPDTVSMILSGHSDVALVMAAINSGSIWRYLTKPWQTDDLRVAINNALELYESQIERKKLMDELRVKNDELSRWGQILAEKVKAQTCELYNQSLLLKMILEGRDFASLSAMISTFVSELFKVRGVYIFDPANDTLHPADSAAESLPENWRAIVEEVIVTKSAVAPDGNVFYPLQSEDDCSGVLIIPGTQVPLDSVREYFDGYVSIAAIALSHHRLRQDAPALIDNIDNLLDNLR